MKLILVIGIIAIFGIQLAAAKHVLKMASPNPEEGLSPEVFTMVSGANMTSRGSVTCSSNWKCYKYGKVDIIGLT